MHSSQNPLFTSFPRHIAAKEFLKNLECYSLYLFGMNYENSETPLSPHSNIKVIIIPRLSLLFISVPIGWQLCLTTSIFDFYSILIIWYISLVIMQFARTRPHTHTSPIHSPLHSTMAPPQMLGICNYRTTWKRSFRIVNHTRILMLWLWLCCTESDRITPQSLLNLAPRAEAVNACCWLYCLLCVRSYHHHHRTMHHRGPWSHPVLRMSGRDQSDRARMWWSTGVASLI